MTNYGLNKPQPSTPADNATPPQPPYSHGQQFNGYVYDANLNQWLLVNKGETVAGKQPRPSKKLLVGVVVGAIVTVGALVGAANLVPTGSSSATGSTSSDSSYLMTPEDRFIREYKDSGYSHNGGDKGILDGGYLVCEGLDAGLSERQIVQSGYQGNQRTNGSMDRADIQVVVDLATTYLCPEWN